MISLYLHFKLLIVAVLDVPDLFAMIQKVQDTPQVADHLRVAVAWHT